MQRAQVALPRYCLALERVLSRQHALDSKEAFKAKAQDAVLTSVLVASSLRYLHITLSVTFF